VGVDRRVRLKNSRRQRIRISCGLIVPECFDTGLGWVHCVCAEWDWDAIDVWGAAGGWFGLGFGVREMMWWDLVGVKKLKSYCTRKNQWVRLFPS